MIKIVNKKRRINMIENISFVGLGKLGCSMAASLASRGFNVLGIDLNPETVDKINKGKAPHYEPGLENLIKENKMRFKATTNYAGIKDTDMTFIMVPTPSNEDGGFKSEYIEAAAIEVGRNIPDNKDYHVVVITSTVMPGTMDKKIKPVVENSSGRRVSRDPVKESITIDDEKKEIEKKPIGLCYNPMFMAIGDVIHGYCDQPFIIIGSEDDRSYDELYRVYMKLTGGIPEYRFHRMNFYNAEWTKLAINEFRMMKISFAGTIMNICENTPPGDAREVLDAVGSDPNIGRKFLHPGIGYGGFCFARDGAAFVEAADQHDTYAYLAYSADLINQGRRIHIQDKLLRALIDARTDKLSVLGITYKPNAVYATESQALKIIKKLCGEGIEVRAYDPAFKLGGINDLPPVPCLGFCKTIDDCLKGSKVCFIATPWPEFHRIPRTTFLKMESPRIVIDGWPTRHWMENDQEFDYRPLGVNKDG